VSKLNHSHDCAGCGVIHDVTVTSSNVETDCSNLMGAATDGSEDNAALVKLMKCAVVGVVPFFDPWMHQ